MLRRLKLNTPARKHLPKAKPLRLIPKRNLMKNQKKLNNFFVKCFGCQYNEFDATTLTNNLTRIGFVETTLDEADFVFVLNCSVRKTGVDRAMGFIRNLANKQVFLSGCVLEPDKKRFLKKGVTLFELSDLPAPRSLG